VVMGLCNAGSCAVLVCVLGGWLYTAHVGDCRAVLASLPKATAATAAGASAHGQRRRRRGAGREAQPGVVARRRCRATYSVPSRGGAHIGPKLLPARRSRPSETRGRLSMSTID
jgi:serine/threonine protein phosphatase PrpC